MANPTAHTAHVGCLDERTVQAVCEEVFDEYSAWHRRDAEDALNFLCRGEGPASSMQTTSPEVRPADFTSRWKGNGGLEWFYPGDELCVGDKAGGLPLVANEVSLDVAPRMESFPTYESCAPILGNIWIGDDADTLSFVPYSDESGFPHDIAQVDYGDVGWDTERVSNEGECLLRIRLSFTRLRSQMKQCLLSQWEDCN